MTNTTPQFPPGHKITPREFDLIMKQAVAELSRHEPRDEAEDRAMMPLASMLYRFLYYVGVHFHVPESDE